MNFQPPRAPSRQPPEHLRRPIRRAGATALFGAVLCVAASASAAPLPHLAPGPGIRPSDFHPSLSSIRRGPGARAPSSPNGSSRFDDGEAPVEQIGETVVMQGDYSILTDDGSGGLAIDLTQNNPEAIANRFYETYPDEFDELIVLTTFTDSGSPDALAYEISVQQDVRGIGTQPMSIPIFDESAAWGSTSGHLHAFVNMKSADAFTQIDGLPIDDARSQFYPVLGQEFAHRWLAFVNYRDANGALSTRMIGRAGAHWSVLLQAQGSVIDGNHWVEDAPGSFNCVERMVRYSQLDLYLMGLLPPREVEPMFVIDGGRIDGSTTPIDPLTEWYRCQHVTGTREDIGIEQIIAAMGPRVPAWPDSEQAFRVAFVLLTRPDELAGDVEAQAEQLERARKIWEEKFTQYTGGRGSLCTQVSGPCGTAAARITVGSVVEDGGNGNGIIESGEPVAATFTLVNDGPIDARSVAVTADSTAVTFAAPTVIVDDIPAGTSQSVTLRGTFSTDRANCDAVLTVGATAVVGAATFKGFAQARVGAVEPYHQSFDDNGGLWGVNLDGKDTALTDTFAWGDPNFYSFYGYFTLQPGGGLGGSGGAWFTGLSRGDVSTGADHGLAVGTATLWSPWLQLPSQARPIIHYAAWFIALDTTIQDRLQCADDDLLLLEGTNDGVRFYKLDQVDCADDRWQPRAIDPTNPTDGEIGLDLTRPIQFRYTVNRSVVTDFVEAGVDDFAIVADAPGCVPSLAADAGAGADLGVVPFPDTGCSVGAGRASVSSDEHSGDGRQLGSVFPSLAPILPRFLFAAACAALIALRLRQQRRQRQQKVTRRQPGERRPG